MSRLRQSTLILLAFFSTASIAGAAPLRLSQLDDFSGYLTCKKECEVRVVAKQEECLTCGEGDGCQTACNDLASCLADCVAPEPDWEKNRVEPTNGVDGRLSVLEYWDEGNQNYICYESEAVLPKALCGCTDSHALEECVDEDGDGLALWLEQQLGTSDAYAQKSCSQNDQCAGFDEHCQRVDEADLTLCLPRSCAPGCDAFHLEAVAENYQELIVHVHYDYSPVPATVLDLYINYNKKTLFLLDSRGLPALQETGKQVATNNTRRGVRVAVVGAGSSEPVPFGPIVELVFQRVAGQSASVWFAEEEYYRTHSMAPNQQEHHQQLADDSRWGEKIQVGAASASGPRMTFYASFDNPKLPLDLNEAESFCPENEKCETFCAQVDSCRNKTEETIRASEKSQLAALQKGLLQTSQSIEGVSGPGVYLDGAADRIELPIVLNQPESGDSYRLGDQDFSLSFWFWSEAGRKESQLLFSHNNQHEKTDFGLLWVPEVETSRANLVWFEGDVRSPKKETVLFENLIPLHWTHLGLSVDAQNGKAQVYLNGVPSQPMQVDDPVLVCPEFDLERGLVIHKEGDILTGGVSPEMILLATEVDGRYGIEQMDAYGLSKQDLLREGAYSIKDPDFSQEVEKLVFSSNRSGSFEIWISDRDGVNAQQITEGFGDTTRGIFARRPKWAPDASAIIFESNAYLAFGGKEDNAFSKGYRLYYVKYNRQNNKVEAGPDKTEILEYESLVLRDKIDDFRLKNIDVNNTRVHWLGGATSEDLGVVLYQGANSRGLQKVIRQVTLKDQFRENPTQLDLGITGEKLETTLLSAIRPIGENKPVRVLFNHGRTQMKESDQFSLRIENATENRYEIVIEHTPTGYFESCTYQEEGSEEEKTCCWDRNFNKTCDQNEGVGLEDLNGGGCDVTDCYPPEIFNLFLTVDPSKVNRVDSSLTEAVKTLGKSLKLDARTEGGIDILQVTIESSAINQTPIPAGELARIVVDSSQQGGSCEAKQYEVENQLMIKNIDNSEARLVYLGDQELESVQEGEFSPDGEQFIVYGIQNARPVMLAVKDDEQNGVFEARKISEAPAKVSGIRWLRYERYYPCNWLGAYLQPDSKRFVRTLQGGLDELKLYSYVREAGGFLSEAQRGFERLREEDRLGPVDPVLPKCTKNTDCPAYHVCIDETCQVKFCDQNDPYACRPDFGQCTLAPVWQGTDNGELAWVCTAECGGDHRECYTKQCLNGPCRFCSPDTQSCIECKDRDIPIGKEGDTIRVQEGCPDRNSFVCDQGSCLSECYAFEDGQSRYLCDPELEYCKQGKCAPLTWSWRDFAPATLSGLGEAEYDYSQEGFSQLPHLRAQDQLHEIKIWAYGVEDYLHPPELTVEGMVETDGARVYNGNWFEIGRVLVYNYRYDQADDTLRDDPYTLFTHFPITRLRLRLTIPLYENMNAAASGMAASVGPAGTPVGTQDFCRHKAEQWAVANGTAVDYGPCVHRAPGSRATLGYRVGIPMHESYRACVERGVCTQVVDSNLQYLYGGQPAVIVTGLEVRNQDVMPTRENHTICSYEGEFSPIEDGNYRWVYYGNAELEQSNIQRKLYSQADETHLLHVTDINFPALLNCNYVDLGTGGSSEIAAMEFDLTKVNIHYGDWGSANVAGINIEEHPDGTCIYEVGEDAIPCYEWYGGAVTVDTLALIDSGPQLLFKVLEFDEFRLFGYDEQTLYENQGQPRPSPEERDKEGIDLGFDIESKTSGLQQLEISEVSPASSVMNVVAKQSNSKN